MPYEFVDELTVADIAFRAWGQTLEETFMAAADAVMNAMVDELSTIQPRETRTLTVEHEALDLLLFNFLQEFIYYKDAEQLLLRVQELHIAADSQPIDPPRHRGRRTHRPAAPPDARRRQSGDPAPFLARPNRERLGGHGHSGYLRFLSGDIGWHIDMCRLRPARPLPAALPVEPARGKTFRPSSQESFWSAYLQPGVLVRPTDSPNILIEMARHLMPRR